jgi:hypothetical protein
MRFTFNEIKKDLLDNWAEFTEQNADDKITEYADGYCPIYNNEIIQDWAEMPSEFNDSWRESCDGLSGIIAMMSYDLFTFYLSETTRAYDQLKKEREEND